MTCSVYWIRHPDHTDMFTQGYIGISSNVKQRWESHSKNSSNLHIGRAVKKYGWNNLIKEVLVIADEVYCLMIEAKLRVEKQIGWNVIEGGGMPPKTGGWNKGRKIPKEELTNMKAKGFGFDKGHKTWNAGLEYTEEMKAKIYDIGSLTRGKPAHNKGKPMLPQVLEALQKSITGKPQSEESKYKKSLANKGRVFEKVTCPNCEKTGGLTGMKQWHFNNCTGNKMFNARTTIHSKRIFIGNFATKELANLAIQTYRKEVGL